MSDVLDWNVDDEVATAPRRRRRGPLIAVAAVVGLVALAAAVVTALDLRGTTAEVSADSASHRALVAASSAWEPLWDQLELEPKYRDLDAITSAAHVGVDTPGGTWVRTEVVVNDPTVLAAIITVQSDGITTYIAQVVRQNLGWGIVGDSQSTSCDAGTMSEGRPCLDVVHDAAVQWSTSRIG